MSDQGLGPEPAIHQFEIVGPLPGPGTSRSRRFVAVGAVAAVVAAAVGGGIWAWQAWTAQGAQPSKALPANTLAYAALDLDPPGQQKVAAFRTLRKFPSLKKQLGLDSADDLSESIVKNITEQSSCDLDFSHIKPWIGDRLAFAVVAQDKPEPVVVVQVKDADQARAGLKAAGSGCDTKDFGYAVDGNWAVLARNDAVAEQVSLDAQRRSLDDDADFRALTKAAGDPGLVTLYAAPAAGKALLDEIDRSPWGGWAVLEVLKSAVDPASTIITGLAMTSVATASFDEGAVSSPTPDPNLSPRLQKEQARLERRFEHFDDLPPRQQRRLLKQQEKMLTQIYGGDAPGASEPSSDVPDDSAPGYASAEMADGPDLDPALRSSLQHFSGLGGVARFADGTLEVVVTGDELKGTFADAYAGRVGGDLVSKLPAGSAVGFGAGFAARWVDSLITDLKGQYPFAGGTDADTIAAFEKATGLDYPSDLEALGGDGVALVAGSGFSPDRAMGDVTHLPVAVRIKGDAGRIEAALDKLRNGIGPDAAAKLGSRRVGDDVVVGPDADYLDQLAKGGADLGHSDRFERVTPDAGDATTVFYVDFDSGDWLARAAAPGDRKDAEPLDTLGMTRSVHDGQQRIVLRVSFDD